MEKVVRGEGEREREKTEMGTYSEVREKREFCGGMRLSEETEIIIL